MGRQDRGRGRGYGGRAGHHAPGTEEASGLGIAVSTANSDDECEKCGNGSDCGDHSAMQDEIAWIIRGVVVIVALVALVIAIVNVAFSEDKQYLNGDWRAKKLVGGSK